MTVKNVEKLEKSRVAVTVEVGAEEFEAAVAQGLRSRLRGKLSIPGFRPGKAPRKMIEKHVRRRACSTSDAVDIALPEAYTQAVVQGAGLRCCRLSRDRDRGRQIGEDGFTFKATVAVYPEVKLGEYKGLDGPQGRGQGQRRRTSRSASMRWPSATPASSPSTARPRRATPPSSTSRASTTAKPFEGGKGENYEPRARLRQLRPRL